MSRIYLPTSEQMNTMNENLAKIAAAVGSQVDLSTWKGIRKAVLAKIAPDVIPVGTLLTVKHSVYGDKPWVVLGHNVHKNAHNPDSPTMTLGAVPVLGTLQFDAPESICQVNADLPAGTYNFTITAYDKWTAGTYQFTTTQTIPSGGRICVSGQYPYQGNITAAKVSTYARGSSTAIESNLAITAGSGGTNLGTAGEGTTNHTHRIAYGSNNYKESALRQFLNSASPAGSVWTPQTKFDQAPSWMTSTAGFLNGLEAELQEVLCDVTVPCGSNNVYEAPDSTVVKGSAYTVTDKIFPLSNREIGFTSDINDGSALLPYYEGATNADRIKYNASGVAAGWWVRTPGSGGASAVRLVVTDGTLNGGPAGTALGLAPACTIG